VDSRHQRVCRSCSQIWRSCDADPARPIASPHAQTAARRPGVALALALLQRAAEGGGARGEAPAEGRAAVARGRRRVGFRGAAERIDEGEGGKDPRRKGHRVWRDPWNKHATWHLWSVAL